MLKIPSAWNQLSSVEEVGNISIGIYLLAILNWFSYWHGYGGLDFDSEKSKAWADIIVAGLPFIWLATGKSHVKAISVYGVIALFLLFAFLFTFAVLVFFVRGEYVYHLESAKPINSFTTFNVYTQPGDALDAERHIERLETSVLPGIKWIRVIQNIPAYEVSASN